MLATGTYSICIRPEGGLGCVDFRESGGTTDSFRLDANADAAKSEVGGGCTDTFLIIPNIDVADPRYCGSKLAATNDQTEESVVRSTGHIISVFSSTTNKATQSSFDLMYTQVQ